MNRRVKAALRNLSANVTPSSIDRIGKSIGVVQKVCSVFEDNTRSVAEKHKIACWKKDLEEVLSCLQDVQPFVNKPGRRHEHFQFTKGLLESVSITNIIKWLNEQYKSRYVCISIRIIK